MRGNMGPFRPGQAHLALVLIVWCGVLFGASCCAPVDCSDGSNALFLRTSASQINVRAAEAIFCPIMPGESEQDCTTFLTYRMTRLDEMSNPIADFFCMDFPDPPEDAAQFFTALQSYTQSNFTCVGDIVDTDLAPGVSARVLTTTFTLPSYPDFYMQLNYSVSNASIDFNYGTSEFMEGRDYIVSYRPDQIKQTFGVRNFPWAGNPLTDKSYIALYFHVTVSSNKPYTMSFERTLNNSYVQVETDNLALIQTLDHASEIDGIPYFKRFNNRFYDSFRGDFPANNASFIAGGTTSCFPNLNGTSEKAIFKQFDVLNYDPQFSVLFGQVDPMGETPSEKKSKTGVIVGASVAAVIVAGAVIGIALAVVYVPSFRAIVKPFSRSKNISTTSKNNRISGANDTSNTSHQGLSENSNHNGWVKASKGN